jgi:septum formation inhibitor MinC
MAKKNKKENKISKKEIALAIYTRLDTALSDYQPVIGERKFINQLKKTAKSLAEEIAEVSKKQKAKLKRESKKAGQKKSVKKKKVKPAGKPVLKKNKTKETPVSDSHVSETAIEQPMPPPPAQ